MANHTIKVVANVVELFLQMYNVKQTQSEIHELKEKLSIQQQKNQLNELSNEREGKLPSNKQVTLIKRIFQIF